MIAKNLSFHFRQSSYNYLQHRTKYFERTEHGKELKFDNSIFKAFQNKMNAEKAKEAVSR
jgi:hypothetical protein